MHQLVNVVVAVSLGHQRIARFALLWVRNVITVVYLIAKVCRRKLSTERNTQQNNRINNIETSENSDQNSCQESQNVNYINYNEQINSDYDSSDDNYVATVENIISPQAALKNMMITIGNSSQ